MKMWKENANTTLLFSLKGLILLQEIRAQVETKVMEHLNGIHKSRPANKQEGVFLPYENVVQGAKLLLLSQKLCAFEFKAGREECSTYLTHICTNPCSVEKSVKK